MYKILKNEKIASNIYLIEIEAPLIASKALPGEFVIVMASPDSEKVPLTIVDYDKTRGVLTLIYQIVGASTLELSKETKELYSIIGPLGNASSFVKCLDDYKNKRILFVGGGVGIAPILPQIKYLDHQGIKSDCIYGMKSKDMIILENDLKKYVNNLYIMTDDGSYGEKGLVTKKLKSIIDEYDIVITIGPVIMMKYVSEMAASHNKKVIVSMNPIMVDGTGMCGACRVVVDGKIKFACVDGPEFDGEHLDFDTAISRMELYKTAEGRAYLKEIEGSTHTGGCHE